jgi:hypothetical protein
LTAHLLALMGVAEMEKFSLASERLFHASAELRNRMAEVEQLRAAIASAEAAARARNLTNPKIITVPAGRDLRA